MGFAEDGVRIEKSYEQMQIRKNPKFATGGINGDGDCNNCWCSGQCTEGCEASRQKKYRDIAASNYKMCAVCTNFVPQPDRELCNQCSQEKKRWEKYFGIKKG